MFNCRENEVESVVGTCSESEVGLPVVAGGLFPETPPRDTSDDLLSPDELETAAALVERRIYESPDSVLTLVDVAETECGWWLLTELVSERSAWDDDAGDGSATRELRGSDPASRDPLVETLTSATGRPTESVFHTLHTVLLPKLLVTDLLEHGSSTAPPPDYGVTVRLRAESDVELVSAVLLLVAAAAELAEGDGADTWDGDADARVDEAMLDAVGRFSTVVERIRESSRRANQACERASTDARR